jgi:Periplasmic binding protein
LETYDSCNIRPCNTNQRKRFGITVPDDCLTIAGIVRIFAKNIRVSLIRFCLLGLVLLAACTPPRRTTSTPPRPGGGNRPVPSRPSGQPIDTVRWAPAPTGTKPPIGSPGNTGGTPSTTTYNGETYRLALLLPFLTNQFTAGAVPEKSTLALQFYGGAQIALQQLSTEEGLNLQVDVLDTQTSDADFQKLWTNPRLAKAQVLIGPVRPTHVSLMAGRIKSTRQILISPEVPNMGLTAQNPDFLQTNPSLKAHCEAIVQHVRRKNPTAEVVVVSKPKEAERLLYLQNAAALSGARFKELTLPDEAVGFDKADFSPFLRVGRTTVVIAPTWAGQDFVMSLLRRLKAVKGSARVEVYGMPQWRQYDNIEPEFLMALNVHISSASYINYEAPEVRAFQQKFYDMHGAIPDDDAFNGYDVTLFTGKMLKKYGLSFPQRLTGEVTPLLHGRFQFSPTYGSAAVVDRPEGFDYLENKFVHILKFAQYGFVPAE